jgi:hypothetical protein
MGHGYVPDYGQAKPRAPEFPAPGSIHPVKPFEESWQVLGWYALAFVTHTQVYRIV